MRLNRTWESASAERKARHGDMDHIMQVNGYNNDAGEFVTFDPPLMIDIRDLPPSQAVEFIIAT